MNKNAMLGALVASMLGVVAYLLFSSGAIGNKTNSYSPYAQNAYMNQMPPQQPGNYPNQAGQVGYSQQAAVQQPQAVQQVQTQQQQSKPKQQKQIAPKKVKSSPPPVTPAPALLQTQNMAQLNTLLNTFGNPIGPDQTKGCFIHVEQWGGSNWTTIAVVDEKCVETPYNNAIILWRTNGEPFFNMFGGSYSLLRYDGSIQDINLYEPMSPGLWFGSNVGGGPTPHCVVADNSSPNINSPIRITACVQ